MREKFIESQQPAVAAASQRAPMRGEILAITVTTTSKRFRVLPAWKSRHVRFQADGGDVYLQVSTAEDAACDPTARAQESGNPVDLTPSVSGNGCFKIADGTWLDVPFGATANTFALITTGTGTVAARCHLSES